MGLFRKKGSGRNVDISDHIWSYDDSPPDFKLDVGGFDDDRHRSRAERREERLGHYFSAGGADFVAEPKEKKTRSVENRPLVIRWAVFLALFWLVFRFVHL